MYVSPELIRKYIQIHKYTNTQIYKYTYINMYICMYLLILSGSIYIYTNIKMYIYTHLHIYTCIYLLCSWGSIYTCTNIQIYLYTYLHMYMYVSPELIWNFLDGVVRKWRCQIDWVGSPYQCIYTKQIYMYSCIRDTCIHVYMYPYQDTCMGWLWLVGSIKL